MTRMWPSDYNYYRSIPSRSILQYVIDETKKDQKQNPIQPSAETVWNTKKLKYKCLFCVSVNLIKYGALVLTLLPMDLIEELFLMEFQKNTIDHKTYLQFGLTGVFASDLSPAFENYHKPLAHMLQAIGDIISRSPLFRNEEMENLMYSTFQSHYHTNNITLINLDTCTFLTDSSLLALSKYYPNLQSLSLRECSSLTANCLPFIQQYHTNLKSLNLNGCRGIRTASLLPFFTVCNNIRILDLSRMAIGKKTMCEIFRILVHLESCTLDFTDQCGVEAISVLAETRTLTFLECLSPPFHLKSDWNNWMNKFCSLDTLILSDCQLSDEHVAEVTKACNLSRIELYYCNSLVNIRVFIGTQKKLRLHLVDCATLKDVEFLGKFQPTQEEIVDNESTKPEMIPTPYKLTSLHLVHCRSNVHFIVNTPSLFDQLEHLEYITCHYECEKGMQRQVTVAQLDTLFLALMEGKNIKSLRIHIASPSVWEKMAFMQKLTSLQHIQYSQIPSLDEVKLVEGFSKLGMDGVTLKGEPARKLCDCMFPQMKLHWLNDCPPSSPE